MRKSAVEAVPGMNLRLSFEHRSGRVIAVFRAVLAVVFLLALLIEPAESSSRLRLGEIVLGGYVGVSVLLIALAWRSWWYDQLLALPMLVLDIGVFLVSVHLTESLDSDFGSPFLALFALAVLSATLRWDWRMAVRTGIIVIVLFVLVGFAMVATDQPFDALRFGRRTFYMVALLLVLVWFGLQRRDPGVPLLDLPPDEPGGDAGLWRALEYALAETGATCGIIVWADAEEPWIELRAQAPAGRVAERHGPEMLVELEPGSRTARLFDLPRRRKLVRLASGWPSAQPLVDPVPFARAQGIETGLSLPFRTASGQGLLVLGGIVGTGPDYVTLGGVIAREIGHAFDRQAVARFEREALVARTRSALARDLHDSVAQSLAGACFRLEALRRGLQDGGAAHGAAIADEIATVRDALRREQAHVRSLIDGLRVPAQPLQQRDLAADLGGALADAGAHWGIGARLEAPADIQASGWLSHEIQQLLREAVANAARHGLAGRVTVGLAREGGQIVIDIHDDGGGFAVAGRQNRPWSISERVAALGGSLTVDSGTSGTHLAIVLPG